MSAFLVSDKHINAILSWGNRHQLTAVLPDGDRPNRPISFSDWTHLQEMACILKAENIRSLLARYTHDKPEDYDATIEYRFYPNPFEPTLDPVQIVKACNCYDHQACKTADYYQTTAGRIVDRIRSHAIAHLPGYEQAAWQIR